MRKLAGVFLLCMLAPGLAAGAEMTISGAASLTNVFTELKGVFEKEHPGLTVNVNFAASNPLLRQLAEGAPVDVFATADQETMDKAIEAKLVDAASCRIFARNDLALITPNGRPKPARLYELANMERIAIGNPASVPAGRYAKAALEKAGIWQKLEKKLILADSVRQALDYVAREEAEAAFVYATDARQMGDKVDVALVVDGHDPVLYPAAIAVTGNNQEAGRQFIELLLSERGREALVKYGFQRP